MCVSYKMLNFVTKCCSFFIIKRAGFVAKRKCAGIAKCADYYKTGHNSKHVKSQVMQKSGVHNATIEWIPR